MEEPEHWESYRLLGLSAEATLADLEAAYRQKFFEVSRQGSKQSLATLKAAYAELKEYLEHLTPTPDHSPSPVEGSSPISTQSLRQTSVQLRSESSPDRISTPEYLRFALRQAHQKKIEPLAILLKQKLKDLGYSFDIDLTLTEQDLDIQIISPDLPSVLVAKTLVSKCIHNWPDLRQIRLSGKQYAHTPARWTTHFSLWQGNSQDPFNRFSFNSPLINSLALPIAAVLALFFNATLFYVFLEPWQIWIHEFGHATVAWFSGYQAIPLPFGWTNVGSQQSWFVYFGILFLLMLLLWSGWRERLKWTMGLALSLLVIQFFMTWIMGFNTYEVLLAFGGVGGEFYLSTFLMVAFYFRFPDRWRWDFWRFFILIIAAHTFWHEFWRWHLIERGQAQIPWGSLLGGEGDQGGDMNFLNASGWSTDQIINTYSYLGNVCLAVLIGIYAFFVIRMNPETWLQVKQNLILWLNKKQTKQR
jgi:hypothetical protein